MNYQLQVEQNRSRNNGNSYRCAKWEEPKSASSYFKWVCEIVCHLRNGTLTYLKVAWQLAISSVKRQFSAQRPLRNILHGILVLQDTMLNCTSRYFAKRHFKLCETLLIEAATSITYHAHCLLTCWFLRLRHFQAKERCLTSEVKKVLKAEKNSPWT